MVVQLNRRIFTVEEFHSMTQAGILAEDDMVELLDGEIIQMTPIGSRHAACVNRLNRWLSRHAGERILVSVQNPIRLGEHSEPQPDIALLYLRPDYYVQDYPWPQDVLLIIEVAEKSVEVDREVKIPLYAGAEIQEIWLVNLPVGCVEVYRGPSFQWYGEVKAFRSGQYLSVPGLPESILAVDEILA